MDRDTGLSFANDSSGERIRWLWDSAGFRWDLCSAAANILPSRLIAPMCYRGKHPKACLACISFLSVGKQTEWQIKSTSWLWCICKKKTTTTQQKHHELQNNQNNHNKKNFAFTVTLTSRFKLQLVCDVRCVKIFQPLKTNTSFTAKH